MAGFAEEANQVSTGRSIQSAERKMSWPKASELFEEKTIAPVMTDAEIAVHMGLSKARVFQLRLRAMAKIRNAAIHDPDLRDAIEELTGRRLPPPSRCETPECSTPIADVRTVAMRRGRRFVGRTELCS